MSARDLAIGILLGGGGGGTGYDLAFREIIDNSKVVKTLPVNNKFKFTLNVMAVHANPRETTAMINTTRFFSNVHSQVVSVDSSGTVNYYLDYIVYILCFVVGYEDDTPIFANIAGQNTHKNSYRMQPDSSGNMLAYPYGEYFFDVTDSVITANLTLWNPSDTQFMHSIYNADDNYRTTFSVPYRSVYKDYYMGSDAEGNFAYVALTQDDTENVWFSSARTYGNGTTFTNMTIPQYLAKYQEIVNAINAEHGVTSQAAVFGRIYDSYPY